MSRGGGAATAAGSAVVVTGLGVVSAWGWGVEPFWQGLLSGETGIGGFGRFDHAAYRTHVAGEVPPPPPELAAELAAAVPGWERLAWVDRFAIAAAREAAAAAGLDDAAPAGLFFGSSTGGMLEAEEFYRQVRHQAAQDQAQDQDQDQDQARSERGQQLRPDLRPELRPELRLISSQHVSAPAEAAARHLGVSGPVETFSSACASGTLALGRALDALRLGEVEQALAGGSDSLCRITYGGFNALRSVDEQPCRPFRRERAGLSIGEGAAVLVLETAASAARRGAPVLAVLAGAAASSDAHHMTAPHPAGRGAIQALEQALADAGETPASIGFVNAHGTGTPLNDAAEWAALSAVFGEAAERLPVSATKASVGHLLGSAGAIEAVATVLCLARGVIHPSPGAGEADPELPVDLVTGAARPLPERTAAVSLNLAFGGCNAALVFRAA